MYQRTKGGGARQLFGEVHDLAAEHTASWQTLEGFNVDDCPTRAGVKVPSVVMDNAKIVLDAVKAQVDGLDSRAGGFTLGRATYVFQHSSAQRHGFNVLALVLAKAVNLVQRALRGPNKNNPRVFIGCRLEEDEVDADLWLDMSGAKCLQSQLSCLTRKETLQDFCESVRAFIQAKGTMVTSSDVNRLINLDQIDAFLDADGTSQTLLLWVNTEFEADRSRKGRVLAGLPTGPPKYFHRKNLKSVRLSNAVMHSAENVLQAAGLNTQVYGHMQAVFVTEPGAFNMTEEDRRGTQCPP